MFSTSRITGGGMRSNSQSKPAAFKKRLISHDDRGGGSENNYSSLKTPKIGLKKWYLNAGFQDEENEGNKHALSPTNLTSSPKFQEYNNKQKKFLKCFDPEHLSQSFSGLFKTEFIKSIGLTIGSKNTEEEFLNHANHVKNRVLNPGVCMESSDKKPDLDDFFKFVNPESLSFESECNWFRERTWLVADFIVLILKVSCDSLNFIGSGIEPSKIWEELLSLGIQINHRDILMFYERMDSGAEIEQKFKRQLYAGPNQNLKMLKEIVDFENLWVLLILFDIQVDVITGKTAYLPTPEGLA